MKWKKTPEGEERPRRISLGFIKPEILEGNTIYIDFYTDKTPMIATAYSNIDFTYGGNSTRQLQQTKEISNVLGVSDEVNTVPYENFVKRLAGENYGEISYDRLIWDGARRGTALRDIHESSEGL